MMVQPVRIAETRTFPAPSVGAEPKVAVLLNANARAVTDRVIRSLSHVVPEDDLFLSRSELDARRIVTAVLGRGYDTVFCGGGDGTFAFWVNELTKQMQTRNRYGAGYRLPRFGVLKLGTGNGIAGWVNASSLKGDGILDDVLRARAGEVPGVRQLDLIDIEGTRAQFAGLGVDGKVLNDYVSLKQRLGKGMLRHLFTGAGGYFSAVTARTLPYYLLNSTSVDVEVINASNEPAYRVGLDGRPLGEPIGKRELIFRGKVMVACAGTIPFYGFNFRMFPHAGRRPGMMHLRLADAPTTSVLANLPAMWKGTWSPSGFTEVLCRGATMRFARPMPLQIAGDARGYRDEVTFTVAPDPIELLDFRTPSN